MSKSNNLGDFLTDLANTIRTKKGTSAAINAQDFSTEISSIQTGADVSDTTATASDVLQGKDFYLANGTKTTGTIPTFTPDASYTSNQTLSTQNKFVDGDIVIDVSGGGGGGGVRIRQFTSPNGTATDNSGTYSEGDTINFTSTPASGYSTIWYVDGRKKATTNNYTHTVIDRDENVYCLFKKDGTEYLTFMGEDGEFSIYLGGTPTWTGTVEYSTDLSTWTTWNGEDISSANRMLYMRGTTTYNSLDCTIDVRFHISGSNTACLGNVAALLNYNTLYNGGTFTFTSGRPPYAYLFVNCKKLTTPPEITHTAFSITGSCQYMFNGCSLLRVAPLLPATTLAQSCYYYMFYGCTSLIVAPELPATTLADSCYNNMFYGCTSLIVAPELPATTLAPSCYWYMFYGCKSLTTAPELPATTLHNSCYRGMFTGCSSLTTGPKIYATSTAAGNVSFCNSMFQDCCSLTAIYPINVTFSGTLDVQNMFLRCSKLKFSTSSGGGYTKILKVSSNNTSTFKGTAGPYAGDAIANTTYYTANAISS